MGGKSTYLRQVATAVLLAQAGSFVPASSCRAVRRGPDLHARRRGRSPVARRVHVHGGDAGGGRDPARGDDARASSSWTRSAAGTSTFDGLSIAWALVEHLHDTPGEGGFVLFATHYHELTEIALVRPGVANATMAVRELSGRVVFLRKVVPAARTAATGSTSRSWPACPGP